MRLSIHFVYLRVREQVVSRARQSWHLREMAGKWVRLLLLKNSILPVVGGVKVVLEAFAAREGLFCHLTRMREGRWPKLKTET